jgi:hypothetical protein
VQEGGDVVSERSGKTPARVPETANRAGEDPRTAGLARDWSWTEPTVWTQRMLTALETGVKGGKADQTRWPIAYFAGLGLYSLEDAHALVRQPSRR